MRYVGFVEPVDRFSERVVVTVANAADRGHEPRLGVTQVTYYRWRREFGCLQLDQVKRMKELEVENQRLRKAVSDLTLDKLILTEAAKGNF